LYSISFSYCLHEVQKFSSGTGSPGCSRKKGRKTVVAVRPSHLNTAACNPDVPMTLQIGAAGSNTADKSSAVAEMGDRLATTDMGRKVGGCCAPFRGGAGYPSNTMSPGPRPTSIPAVWPHTPTLQTGKTGQRSRKANRFTHGRSKMQLGIH